MTNYEENIKKIFFAATLEETAEGKFWYRKAKEAAQSIGDRTELPLRTVVGVVAALSPTNKWEKNVRDAGSLCEAFVSGGYKEEVSCSTYNKMKDKAWTILQETDATEGEIAAILNGPKITDFFWCIMGHNTCVIDGHAWCIANDDRRAMQEVPTIGKRVRQDLQEAYTKVGEKFGLKAYEMQAITWLAWRRIHGVA